MTKSTRENTAIEKRDFASGRIRAKKKAVADGATPVVKQLLGSKERTFWTFQICGWLSYSLIRTFHGMIAGWQILEYIPMVAATTSFGFLLTIGLRYFYRKVRWMPLPIVVLATLFASVALGATFSAFETSVSPFLVLGSEPYRGLQKLGNAMFESTVIFAWSAIYFGYHYYRGFQEEKERALKATAMAHQAQLKMLRYQLNPHFLFNTLNAISTLVLDKSEVDANRMLTKLSNFLRYTLVNQPTQRVTFEQELHALGLYLDIEKVRFQDRLKLQYDIQDKARDALIPSLILQPIIENAIKYAVAPSMDGGTIEVSAHIDNGRLLIFLKDDGPGIENTEHIVSQSGSGVGLVNTRERLQQIYQNDHKFIIENLTPRGLGILINIPYEVRSPA